MGAQIRLCNLIFCVIGALLSSMVNYSSGMWGGVTEGEGGGALVREGWVGVGG